MILLSCWFAVIDFFLYFILNLLPPRDESAGKYITCRYIFRGKQIQSSLTETEREIKGALIKLVQHSDCM